jgi:hypothetical protein
MKTHKNCSLSTHNSGSGTSCESVILPTRVIDVGSDGPPHLVETEGKRGIDKWINYLAFDIVGEATFSKSFGFLLAGHDIGDSISNQFKLRLYIAIVGHYNFLHDYLLANPLIAYFNLQPSMHIFDTCLAAVEARSKNTRSATT